MSLEGLEISEENMEKLKNIAIEITNCFSQLVLLTKPITDKHLEDHEGKWPISEQYLKVHEETSEAYKGYNRNLVEWKEEHFDMMFAQLTLFHLHKFSRDVMFEEIFNCVKKFYKRGWLVL